MNLCLHDDVYIDDLSATNSGADVLLPYDVTNVVIHNNILYALRIRIDDLDLG